MNDDIIYNSDIVCLFTEDFEIIKTKYNKNIFDWKNYEKIFNYIYHVLSNENVKINDFIKYYYIFTFIYLGYTNFLAYIGHPDITNKGLEKIIIKIKTSSNIVKNLMKFSSNPNVYKIIKLNDIFISNKIKRKKVNDSNITKYVKEYIFDLKQFDKISELPNDNYKKILNLIIYRYVICKKNNYQNYHNLYLKKIIGKRNIYVGSKKYLDFDYFIEQIPNSKKILNIVIDNDSSHIEISIIKLINFVLSKHENKNEFYINDKTSSVIEIKNKKYPGHIKINISNKYENIEFNQYQTNYNFLHYNTDEMKKFNFLKKTFTNIEINIFANILKDLSSIIEFLHLIICGTKILSTNPSDIYECLYPIEYSNYYLNTFCYFLEFFKKEINNNLCFNKFIIDVIKFLYIYSYYDYYFYYSNNFVEALITNLQYKNEMFQEFTNNLKKVLKLPCELNNFPPFFSEEFDINAIIYYNFEIPSYFKLFDFMNAIYVVLEKNKKSNKVNIFDLIINNISIDNQSNYLNSLSKSVNLNIKNSNTKIKKKSKNKVNLKNNSYSSSNSNPNSSSNSNYSSSSNSSSKSSSNTNTLTSCTYNKKKKKNNKELETNLDTEIINILDDDEKTHMENSNAYVELNCEKKTESYILDTEC